MERKASVLSKGDVAVLSLVASKHHSAAVLFLEKRVVVCLDTNAPSNHLALLEEHCSALFVSACNKHAVMETAKNKEAAADHEEESKGDAGGSAVPTPKLRFVSPANIMQQPEGSNVCGFSLWALVAKTFKVLQEEPNSASALSNAITKLIALTFVDSEFDSLRTSARERCMQLVSKHGEHERAAILQRKEQGKAQSRSVADWLARPKKTSLASAGAGAAEEAAASSAGGAGATK